VLSPGRPERDAHRIEVARGQGVVPVSRSELQRSSRKAGLTVGASTMFDGI